MGKDGSPAARHGRDRAARTASAAPEMPGYDETAKGRKASGYRAEFSACESVGGVSSGPSRSRAELQAQARPEPPGSIYVRLMGDKGKNYVRLMGDTF